MNDIENAIRNVNKNDLLKGLKLHFGNFNLEFNDISLPYVNFTDALFENANCRFSINEGVFPDYDDILEQIIGHHRFLDRQRMELLELGFEPVGLSETLFYFKLTVGGTEHFFHRGISLSAHGVFMGNVVYHEKMESHKGLFKEGTWQITDMVSYVLDILKKLSMDEKFLLPSTLRDRIAENGQN